MSTSSPVQSPLQLHGIHHLTAVTADAPGNHAFYTRTLGLRLVKKSVNHGVIVLRDGRPTLDFEDAEGQRFSLINEDASAGAHPWAKSPVPAEHQIRGLGPITLSVPNLAPTDRVLTSVLNMRKAREY